MDRKEAETKCRLLGGTKRKCATKDKLYMQHKDVIPGEHCGCESSDEDRVDGARTLKRGGVTRRPFGRHVRYVDSPVPGRPGTGHMLAASDEGGVACEADKYFRAFVYWKYTNGVETREIERLL